MTEPLADAGYILEQDVRLSESFLWSLQHQYYQAEGGNAWASNTVPEYVSTNPYLARAYARVVLGYLRDCAAEGDGNQPVYIIELGAGSGRFAFHFLRALSGLVELAPHGLPRFCYVMTDFSERNLTAWESHPTFTRWAADGWLDFAFFDAAGDTSLSLRRQGALLAPASLEHPAVVIANYLFDSLSQDVYHINEEGFQAGLLTVRSTQPEPERSDPSLLERISTSFRAVPAGAQPYQDAELDGILIDYAHTISAGWLTFPVTALRCLCRLAALSDGRMLLLAGDKGVVVPGDVTLHDPPRLMVYGAFSMNVNLHAVGQLAVARGGRFLRVSRESTLFNTCAALFGRHPQGWAETALAFHEAVENGGPDDFYSLCQGMLRGGMRSLEQALAALRFSAWDPWVFEQCYGIITESLPSAPARLLDDLASAIESVWANYYAPVEDEDTAFDIGTIFEGMERWDSALAFYRQSLELFGPHPDTYTRIAICLSHLDRAAEALENVYRALGLDSTWQPARNLLQKLS